MLEKVLAGVDAAPLRREPRGRRCCATLEADATLRLMFDTAMRVDDMPPAPSGPTWTTGPTTTATAPSTSAPARPSHDRYAPVTPSTWAALRRWRDASPDPDRAHHHRVQQPPSARPAHPTTRRLRRNPHHGPLGAPGPRFERRPRRGHRVRPDGPGRLEVPSRWSSRVRHALEGQQGRRPAVPQRPRRPPSTEPEARPGVQNLADAFAEAIARPDGVGRARGRPTDGPSSLGAARDHPEPSPPQRARILELWPKALADHPPPDCARGGCCGMVGFSISTGGRASTMIAGAANSVASTVRNARKTGQPGRTGHDATPRPNR